MVGVKAEADVTVEIDARRNPMAVVSVFWPRGKKIPRFCFRRRNDVVVVLGDADLVQRRSDGWIVQPEQKILLALLLVVDEKCREEKEETIAATTNNNTETHQSVWIAVAALRFLLYFKDSLGENDSMPIGAGVAVDKVMPDGPKPTRNKYIFFLSLSFPTNALSSRSASIYTIYLFIARISNF